MAVCSVCPAGSGVDLLCPPFGKGRGRPDVTCEPQAFGKSLEIRGLRQVVRINKGGNKRIGGAQLDGAPALRPHQAGNEHISGRRKRANGRQDEGHRETHDEMGRTLARIAVRHVEQRIGSPRPARGNRHDEWDERAGLRLEEIVVPGEREIGGR